MRIDAPWDHQLSRGVEGFIGFDDEILPDQSDTGAVNENVGVVVIDRGHNSTVLNQDAHGAPPSLSLAELGCDVSSGRGLQAFSEGLPATRCFLRAKGAEHGTEKVWTSSGYGHFA